MGIYENDMEIGEICTGYCKGHTWQVRRRADHSIDVRFDFNHVLANMHVHAAMDFALDILTAVRLTAIEMQKSEDNG